MTIELFFSGMTALGTIVAICSLIWAINVYKISNEDKEMASLKKEILTYPGYCKKINRILAEPFFLL